MEIHPPYVVLADDDADDIFIFRECFGEVCFGKELHVVQNGQDLINLLDTGLKPAAIFLDLNMPKMDGKESLLEIRKRPILTKRKLLYYQPRNWNRILNFAFHMAQMNIW